MLANFASDPTKSRGRLYTERATPYRNEFQRDKDRIIHSNTFRRLQYKTQVFISHEGDHYRNRLTHSIEVSSIARSLAKALNVCDDLAECIALAHDIGHTPFGHAGEEALNKCMKDYGGFCHNAQSIKLLTELEQRYAAYDGLNLTWEVIEGIAKHNGPVVNNIPDVIADYDKKHNLDLSKYPSIEAQIAALSDDIAYNCHDLEDGIRAGFYKIPELEDITLIKEIVKNITHKFVHATKGQQIYEIVRELAHILIEDLLSSTYANIVNFNINSDEDIRGLGQGVVSLSSGVHNLLQEIRQFLHSRVYHHPRVMIVAYKCKIVISKLFSVYFDNPGFMALEWQERAKGSEQTKARAIADYIAGMTDRFAIKEYNAFCNFSQSFF